MSLPSSGNLFLTAAFCICSKCQGAFLMQCSSGPSANSGPHLCLRAAHFHGGPLDTVHDNNWLRLTFAYFLSLLSTIRSRNLLCPPPWQLESSKWDSTRYDIMSDSSNCKQLTLHVGILVGFASRKLWLWVQVARFHIGANENMKCFCSIYWIFEFQVLGYTRTM